MSRCLASLVLATGVLAAGELRELPHAPAPADNPLKGFAPYAGQARDFPHSLEFQYLPFRDLMPGPDRFDWAPLDRLLEDVAKRGCQTVFRIWLDYPKQKSGLPAWLQEAGVALRPLPSPKPGRKPSAEEQTPLTDYEHPRLRAALRSFIAALGARYDQDPRVGFITAGLLGWWGEWHAHPAENMMASQAVQDEVMDAYAQAFKRTPILLRYPRPANARRPFGYHDDSFCWATLDTGRKSDGWFYMAALAKAGPGALNRWTTHPIGGETRPEAWPTLWDEGGHPPEYQDFAACVRATHASWLMDSSIARKLTPAQRERALAGARLLGYEFHISHAAVASGSNGWTVTCTVRNTGVAPFYRDWPVEVGVLDAAGKALTTLRPGWSLTGLKPGDAPRRWTATIPAPVAGASTMAVRVANPMPGGKALRFANRDQQDDGDAWLPLGGPAR